MVSLLSILELVLMLFFRILRYVYVLWRVMFTRAAPTILVEGPPRRAHCACNPLRAVLVSR